MPVVDFKVTYLEMFSPPRKIIPPRRDGLSVFHAKKPTLSFYRYLYETVGKPYHWRSRRNLPDAELAALIHDPRMENHVLYVDGVPAGLAELDRRIEGEIELVQFGLVPEFIGQGFGKYF